MDFTIELVRLLHHNAKMAHFLIKYFCICNMFFVICFKTAGYLFRLSSAETIIPYCSDNKTVISSLRNKQLCFFIKIPNSYKVSSKPSSL